MPPSQYIMWQIISIYYPRWVNLRGCFEADICESSRIVRLLSGRIWSDLRCVVSPCQRCGTGCSSGVSSPRSSSTGPWGCSCWSCCSATRGAASSPWCWSAWVSWPPSPGASSPVSPVTSVFLLLFFVPSISSVFRPTSAAFSGAGRWREVTGRKRRRVRWREIVRRLLSNRGRQESTETEREREVLDSFLVHLRVFLFCLWSTESFNFGFRPQFRHILRSKNVVFTPSNTGISWISLFYVSEHWVFFGFGRTKQDI